jgi:hypothetical protein
MEKEKEEAWELLLGKYYSSSEFIICSDEWLKLIALQNRNY